ncbi:MAG: right-handed parallel beta-helix repeat-containing protein, partial [Methanomicrobiales archaeon]|nr:right-handed parallel beta-helix repeat-containing protein [Methanomicrobiales archaeon]
ISGKGGDAIAIVGNRFQTPEKTGVDFAYIADTEIEDNFFTGGVTGIHGENIQRWSVKSNTFQDLKVAFTGNGMSDSILQENILDNCTMGYTLLSSRDNLVQADRFHNLTQYFLLLNSPSHQVTIGSGNNATLISRDLSSAAVYRTSWLTLSGQNFAFSLTPAGNYAGFRSFGERVQITSEINRTRDTDVVKIDAEADVQMWDDIDPFTFGIYRVDHGAPLFTGVTYVSGQSIRTSTMLNASADGTYALLAKKKTPFGLTIEGITSVFLLVAALAALFLYRKRQMTRRGPPRSRAQEFRKR